MEVDGLVYEIRERNHPKGRMFNDERDFDLFIVKDSEYVEVHRFEAGVAYSSIIFRVGDIFRDMGYEISQSVITIDRIVKCPAVIADLTISKTWPMGGGHQSMNLAISTVLSYSRASQWQKIV